MPRGNLLDSETSQANRVPETQFREPFAVDVYEHDGKRFAMVIGAVEGAHLIGVTDRANRNPPRSPGVATLNR